MGPPLVDQNWRAICQAISEGVEGRDWEVMYHKYKELHQGVNCKKSGENKKAKALWAFKEVAFYDLGSVQQIQTRAHVRRALWEIRFKSSTAALKERPRSTHKREQTMLGRAIAVRGDLRSSVRWPGACSLRQQVVAVLLSEGGNGCAEETVAVAVPMFLGL